MTCAFLRYCTPFWFFISVFCFSASLVHNKLHAIFLLCRILRPEASSVPLLSCCPASLLCFIVRFTQYKAKYFHQIESQNLDVSVLWRLARYVGVKSATGNFHTRKNALAVKNDVRSVPTFHRNGLWRRRCKTPATLMRLRLVFQLSISKFLCQVFLFWPLVALAWWASPYFLSCSRLFLFCPSVRQSSWAFPVISCQAEVFFLVLTLCEEVCELLPSFRFTTKCFFLLSPSIKQPRVTFSLVSCHSQPFYLSVLILCEAPLLNFPTCLRQLQL